MLLSKTADVIWNSKNKKYYVDKGYEFTGMNKSFAVNVEDLTRGSMAIVEVKCDFCGKIMHKQYQKYVSYRKNVAVDSCDCLECESKKAKMALEAIYGTSNIRKVPEIDEKILATCVKRYGTENPFASDEIKKRIVATNIKKYGVPYTMQNKEVREKSVKTCLEKYGVDSYIRFLNKKGEESPRWKGGHEITPRNRQDYRYREWRKAVFDRDKYTCQKCGNKSGVGHAVSFAGHHILNWVSHEDLRYDVDNGITMCVDCHHLFHKTYGIRDNNDAQLNEFLSCS